MIKFNQVNLKTFLNEYWQKKPLLIKQALPNFISPLTPEELAGLSLEDDFESRLVIGKDKKWQLKHGVFTNSNFAELPKNNWTLLVQGVDRYIDEVYDLIQHFDFIPRWKFDDVMMSYAAVGGSVGPHFDYYDVFLLQSSGKRCWHLSSQNCTEDNYIKNAPLRIMDKFVAEETYDVAVGDILYIPPKIAHHGVSLTEDCTTMSFGYRSYSHAEIAEFLNTTNQTNGYYQDPIWQINNKTAFIPQSAIDNANMQAEDFGCFVTKLDLFAIKNLQNDGFNINDCFTNQPYQLPASCKIAYIGDVDNLIVFINGEKFNIDSKDAKAMIEFCNSRKAMCGV